MNTITDTALIDELRTHLHHKRWTLALAESCTGGLLGDLITDLPGSSSFFLGGITAYSNQVKTGVLGVPDRVLKEKGAVSTETAGEMARGARSLMGSSVGVAITGIAGPEGGTPEKPVGLVYIAVLTPLGESVQEYTFRGTRRNIKLQAVREALKLLIRETTMSS